MKKTIRTLSLSIVLAFLGSVNLSATDYLFGRGSNTRVYLTIPSSPSTSGNCVAGEPTTSDQERFVWHCVTATSSGTATSLSSSTGYYLYTEYNGQKYWLRDSNSGGSSLRYSTDASNAYRFKLTSTGLCDNDNYYVYLNGSSICSSSSSSTYSGNLLSLGSFSYVCVSKEGTGGVYTTSNSSWSGTPSAKDDLAHLANGGNSTFTIYAKAASGYYFKGWSKTNSFTDCDPLVDPPTAEKHGPTSVTTPNSTGYHTTHYAMFVPYWKFSASASATSAGGGTATASVTKSEVVASNNSSTTGSTTAKFTANASSGYKFVGWTDSSGGTTVNQGTDNPKTVTITNTTPGSTENVTLYAIFKTSYVVHFNPHNELSSGHSVTGSMADRTLACATDETLPASTFVNTIQTTFDGNGGQLKNLSGTYVNSYTITQNASFRHWTDKGSPETTYTNEGTINRSGLTELTLYAVWNNPKVTFPVGQRGDRTLTSFNTGKKSGESFWPNRSYTVTALWSDPFYASMTATKTTGSDESPTVDSSKKSSDYKGSNNGTATFVLNAKTAKSGYHFDKWTGSGITFSAASSLTTNATVAVSSTAGESSATAYTATANYVQNEYYAALTATSGGNGTVTVDSSPKSTTTSEGNIVFNLTITPNAGYHLDKVEFTSGSGSISGNEVTVKASSNYAVEGDNKAAQYTVKATFAENLFNAKLATAVSIAGAGTSSGTAQVSTDGGASYSTEATKSASSSGGNVTFKIKATPKTGYQFKGWSETNGSTTYKTTAATADYTVTAHSTQGQTKSYNLYAVFDHGTYKVHFDGNGAASGSMSDQTFTHGTAQNLNANAFVNNFTVTYNTQGDTAIDPVKKSRFTGWKYNSTTYSDKQSINLTVAHNSTLNFVAQWASSLQFTLPTPTKTADGYNYTFLGWYDAATGGNRVGGAGDNVNISSDRTLFAHWEACKINIKANCATPSSENIIFNVTKTGSSTHYRLSVTVGGSLSIRDLAPGEYTITVDNSWSWRYNVSPSTLTKTVNTTVDFDFTVSAKTTEKKHDEEAETRTIAN